MRVRRLAWPCALLLLCAGCRGDGPPPDDELGAASDPPAAEPTAPSAGDEAPAPSRLRGSGGAAPDPELSQPSTTPVPLGPPRLEPKPIPLGPPLRDRPPDPGAPAAAAAVERRRGSAGGTSAPDPGGRAAFVAQPAALSVAPSRMASTDEPVAVVAASAGEGTIGLGRAGIVGFGARVEAERADVDEPPSVGGDPAYGSGGGRLGPVPGALGLSPAIQLYTFRADPERGLAAHPRQCRPEYILETIVAVVNRAAGPCEAQRNRIPQAAIDLAYVMCHMPDGVPGCEQTYVGTLWVERTPGTHHDYDLQAFGRVARTCGKRVEAVTGAADRRLTRRGRALGRLFDLCGQRLTGDATSTSASSSPPVEAQ